MRVTVVMCDVCKRKREDFPSGRWEYDFHPGALTIKEDGFNGAPIEWEHLCFPCRKRLCDGVRQLVEEIRVSP